MALYMLSVQTIQRGQGRSAVAAAAYRSGEALTDERLGMAFDFRAKGGVAHTEIMAPAGTPEALTQRAGLWNAAELADKRVDSTPAREVLLALPHELTAEQRRDLVRAFAEESLVKRGMIADIAIHTPGQDGDQRNHHAHIMVTTRDVGPQGFGKKNPEWNAKEFVVALRAEWAAIQNRHLEQALGPEAPRVSEKSFAERGIDRHATQHLGPQASAMERRGERTQRGDDNRAYRAANAERAAAERAYRDETRNPRLAARATLELTAEAESVRDAMRAQRDRWQAERDGITVPRPPSAKAVANGLTRREAAALKRARARQREVERQVQAQGVGLRTIRQWATNPIQAMRRTLAKAHADLDRVLAAQRAVETAQKALEARRVWTQSEAGAAAIANVRAPGVEAAITARRERRTLERSIKRVDARIRGASEVITKLKLAQELNKTTITVPADIGRPPSRSAGERRYFNGINAQVQRMIEGFPPMTIRQAMERVNAGPSIPKGPAAPPDMGQGR